MHVHVDVDVDVDVDDPILSIGIDLDDLRFYRAIHALPPVAETPLVFDTAVPRFLELCDRLGLKATLFAIAEDLRWPEAVACLREAVGAGHEVASHSMSHPYDLSRLPVREIAREVRGSKLALEEATERKVSGFRAPGYNLSGALLAALFEAGYSYDSSILPAPAYFLARAAVIGFMGFTGRRSASIVGRAGDFVRGNAPFRWGGGSLREFPITACGMARLPLIGTALAGGGMLARHLVSATSGLPFVNVEFHALDFLDIDDDRLEPGLRVEPALTVPLVERLSRFEKALRVLAGGRKNLTLADLHSTFR